jgi:hypothetical protein
LQLTQKVPFVLCIALRFIFAQNKGHFLGHLNLALGIQAVTLNIYRNAGLIPHVKNMIKCKLINKGNINEF